MTLTWIVCERRIELSEKSRKHDHLNIFGIPLQHLWDSCDQVRPNYRNLGWVMIGFFSLVQLYLCQNVVRGELNDVGQVIYDEHKNSKFFILFSKYGTLSLSVLIIPGIVYTLRVHGTVEERNVNGAVGITFAFWIWDDAIHVMFWPICMFGIFWTLYLRATPHAPESVKKQWA